FNIHEFIGQSLDVPYELYRVEFRNSKGFLVANFNDEGTLLSTYQRFKNIPVPLAIAKELVKDHKGWAMTKNLYIASGKEDALDKELYRISMQNGKSKKNVKIIPDRPTRGLASN